MEASMKAKSTAARSSFPGSSAGRVEAVMSLVRRVAAFVS
jgi:hypothetical protein